MLWCTAQYPNELLHCTNEAEIKARLAVGSWDDEKRSWAQLYLDEKASKRQRAAQSEMLEAARAAKEALQVTRRCRTFRSPALKVFDQMI